jgi:redox-sensitive bicupin YhaK (pirin superfamily)
MTSGRGILHEEMPKRGPSGAINGFQLWVNLPANLKMSQPRYQEITSTTIPQIKTENMLVRVIAGEVFGVKGQVTEIAANPIYLDVTLEPGAEFTQELPEGHTALAYVFEGSGAFGTSAEDSQPISAVKMVLFGEGDFIRAQASASNPMRFMLIAGAPFKEPIVPYGPFVMNSVEEIQQTLMELRNGTFIK